QIDIPGIVVAFETELSVTDLLVAEFSPKPIATAASPAVAHMTARRIEVSLPVRIEIGVPDFRTGNRGRSVSYVTLRWSKKCTCTGIEAFTRPRRRRHLHPSGRDRFDVAAANYVCGLRVQAVFCRRRHQPRRPPLAKIRSGSRARLETTARGSP